MRTRIRDMREDRDLTQAAMGRYLHCSQGVYSNYERGKINIPIDILMKLALFYQTSIDYLLNLTDEPAPYPTKKKKRFP